MITTRFKRLDGRKQTPPAYDFHITPTLTFNGDGGKKRWGWRKHLALEWGYWAIVLTVMNFNIKKKKK